MKLSNCVSSLGILLPLLFSGGCGAASGSGSTDVRAPVPATVSGTIDVGTAPVGIAVDPATNKIYVADFGTQPILGPQPCSPTGAGVMVIDGATESTTAVGLSQTPLIKLNPVAIALNPGTHTVYVVVMEFDPSFNANGGCTHLIDGVVAIDTSTLSTIGFIHQGLAGFSGIGVNLVTGNIYLAINTLAFHNSVIVLGGNAPTIPVGANPMGVAVNAITNKIYVADSGSNNISIIDGTTNSVIGTIADPNAVAPVAVAANPATNTIYVANSQSNNLTVIDGATDSVTATVPVGTAPSGVDVDSQTNFIYVANAANSQTGDPGSVTVINGSTNATTTLVDPKATNPVAVAVNSATHKVYVANKSSNTVTLIDGAH